MSVRDHIRATMHDQFDCEGRFELIRHATGGFAAFFERDAEAFTADRDAGFSKALSERRAMRRAIEMTGMLPSDFAGRR